MVERPQYLNLCRHLTWVQGRSLDCTKFAFLFRDHWKYALCTRFTYCCLPLWLAGKRCRHTVSYLLLACAIIPQTWLELQIFSLTSDSYQCCLVVSSGPWLTDVLTCRTTAKPIFINSLLLLLTYVSNLFSITLCSFNQRITALDHQAFVLFLQFFVCSGVLSELDGTWMKFQLTVNGSSETEIF